MLWQKLAGLVLAAPLLSGCNQDWTTYRCAPGRQAQQYYHSALADPAKVPTLSVGWTWQPYEAGSFRASPIVFNNTVYIGSGSGYFYAVRDNGSSATQIWRFPAANTPLMGSCGFGAYGIQSSASYAKINNVDAVIFGAPDPSEAPGLGSARLYALNAVSGALIWKSDVVAKVTGCTGCTPSGCSSAALSELHERIGYSGPLVVNGVVYVGVHDSGDDPIQNGKVMAVDLSTGHLHPGFSFVATSTRGGGVWNAPAGDGLGIYFTTGNTRTWTGGSQAKEPPINHGLSALRIDPDTGTVVWKFQPVPFAQDYDPDWAAGAAVQLSSCGELITSVQKDGWSYGIDAKTGQCKWQYPYVSFGLFGQRCKFSPNYPTSPPLHGDTDYKQPGAVWGNVVIMKVGGWGLITPGGSAAGYSRLHALDSCASEAQRVRWIIDVPNTDPTDGYSIGPPTVTGGIVYVTTKTGHLIAIADTSLRLPAGSQCTDEFINPTSSGPGWQNVCTSHGFQVVPTPTVLANVALPDGADAANMRSEPVLANGRVYVGTYAGHVYALWP